MSKVSIEPKHKCPECGDLHDDYDDALDCCRPHIEEVYVCPLCAGQFNTEEDALDCCEWDGEQMRRLTTAELEAQGQMRLPSL